MGIIYKIYNDQGIYFGSSTLSLSKRIDQHYSDLKKWRNGKHGKVMCFDLFKDVEDLNWDTFRNCVIWETVEEVANDDLLKHREKHYITSNKCINKHVPLRTRKEYRDYIKQKNS